jgi:serine/threonine protein kinase/Tfp pilus assembly protein PilF
LTPIDLSRDIPVSDNHHDDDKTQTHIPLMKDTMVGHYRIVEKIGAGGMGEVYLAEDTQLDRKVALKFLPPHLCQDKDCRKRFKREAQAAARLSHPNIVTIHEVGDYQGKPFFVMEHVRGCSLREFSADKELSIEQIIELSVQICDGLQAAHEKGITHRDIKPSNILIDSYGRAKIVDFGLASVVGKNQLTKTGSTLGTIGYMSPEQVQGIQADHRSDLFSLGVVLYELMTQRNPFERDTEAGTIKAVSDDTPQPLARYRADVPDGIQTIIDRALEKQVETRYQTAADMLSDLKRLKRDTSKVTPSVSEQPSIAVLPFTNLSADPEQEYFCDGMAEELINALTHVEGLRVVARTSCFAFKGKQTDIREIGRKLNVDNVLEGSVRKAGNRIRITGQLIKVSDGYHLWSEKYDRELEDVFAIQDEISLAIVDNLKIKLLKEEKSRVIKRHAEGADSYQIYLMGRWFLEKRTAKGLLKAIDCFQSAIEKNPDYALAYAGLADVYHMLPQYSRKSHKELFPKAKEAVLKALNLDENLAEAHISLAMIKIDHEWDWKGGLQACERAVELNPGNANIHHWYGLVLAQLARFEESEREFIRAVELDPFSTVINRNLGSFYYYSGQYDLAVTQLQKAIEMDESHPYTHVFLGFTLFQQSKYEEALVELQKEKEISGSYYLGADSVIGACYAKMGDENRAREVLDNLLQRIKHESINDQYTHVAHLYIFLGEIDKGFELLEKAYLEREIWLNYLKIIPLYKEYSKDPRYIALSKKIGLQD